MISAISVIAAGYLLGSINSAIIISKLLYRDDIRCHGSGNAGMTNMLRTYGKGAAGLTLFGDVFKTALAIFIAGVVFGFNYVGGVSTGIGFCYVAGLFAVLGHIFPIYYGFKGGKGVLVTSAMALILTPLPFLILFAVFGLIVAVSKYVSLGSICVAILYPVVLHGYFAASFSSPMPGLLSLSVIIIAVLIVWCHRANIERISNRTENKISFGKKKDNDEQ
ncbi:MAG: glycerol-3-phosphate 1-O-acyltransferase PlsY [Clostridia bacterium]|nr:glycerol-3-phosphate 1-O-acyltransferase PlsY [Clostridia bacterium]